MTTLYNKIYSISVDEKRITFFRRGIGERGRDIAAIKVALGDAYQAPPPNNSPDDTTIGKQWFNCDGAEETLDSLLTFDNKLKKSLMNYQIQNQFIILSYYWENMDLSSNVRKPEHVYAAIQAAVEIFDSEFGRIGEGTVACMHGWRPNSTASNRSYYNVAQYPVDLIPAFLHEMVESGAIHAPSQDIVLEFYKEIDHDFSDMKKIFEATNPSMKKWLRGIQFEHNYVKYAASSIIGQIVESPLYIAARTILQEIEETGIEDLTPEQRADAISRALEPNHLTADSPFMITNFKIGFFDKTNYTFQNLPDFDNLPAAEQATLETDALVKVAEFYNRQLPDEQESLSLINFIDFRTPSLRPGDVYRAYFEINKTLLDALPLSVSTATSKEDINVTDNTIELREIEQEISDAFCADGKPLSDQEAKVQYEKYKSFANKKKLEISRKLRSAAMKLQEDADSIDGIEVDLGIFGKGNLSQSEIQSLMVSGVSQAVEWAKEDNPKNIEPEKQVKELELTGAEIKEMSREISKNFEGTKEDFENYELSGKQGYFFDVMEEARYISNVFNDLVATCNNAESMSSVVDSVSAAVASTIEELAAREDTIFKFTFESDEIGSIIKSIFVKSAAIRPRAVRPDDETDPLFGRSAKIYKKKVLVDLPEDSPAFGAGKDGQYGKLAGSLKRSRTVNYLRNFKYLHEKSGFFESMFDLSPPCPPEDEKEKSPGSGYGVAYVLRYTKQVTPEEKDSDYNPFHNWYEERKAQVFGKSDKKTDSEGGLFKFKEVKKGDRTFGFENALPMIGEECTYDDIMKLLSNDDGTGLLDMKRLLCEYAACLGLPDFNLKVPKIGDLRWPEMPTIEIPGLSGKQILELLKSILRRAACTFIKGIIDILKSPFCEDKFIDGIYGAGSPTAPEIQKAMAQGFLDLGIPTNKKENAKNFIDGIMSVLSPGELCALFEGDPINEDVVVVTSNIASSYDLGEELASEESITNFFITLGLFLGPEITNTLCKYQVEKETCEEVYSLINQIRQAASRGEDVTPEQIERAAAAAQEELEKKANAVELLGNQASLIDLLPDIGSVQANPILSKPAPIILSAALTAARSTFGLARTSFVTSMNSYASSFYVRRPGLAGRDDGEYNSAANLKIQRAICNLDRFSKLDLDLSSMGSLSTTLNLRKAIMILSDDYKTELYDNGISEPFEIYTLNPAQGNDNPGQMLANSLVSEHDLEATNLGELEARSKDNIDELKPVFALMLPFSAGELREKTRTATTYQQYRDLIYQGQGLNNADVITLNTSYLNKMNQILATLQQDIISNTEAAFVQKTDSIFLEGIKEFYNIELEADGRPGGKELLDLTLAGDSLKTKLKHSLPRLRERVNIEMRDRTIVDPTPPPMAAPLDVMRTFIKVKDPFFIGDDLSFSFCEQIPERLTDDISNIVGSENARTKAYKFFYKNMLIKNIDNYPDSRASHAKNVLNSQFQNRQDHFSDSFIHAYEGIMEQMAGSTYTSRLFEDQDYMNRLDLKVRSKFYFDPSLGCYRNPNNLLKYGAVNFDSLVTEMFSEQYLREFASPENSPLLEDYTTPGAFERAMMNTTVHGFIKLCLVEMLMKGAVSFSVWDIDFVKNNTFYKEYLVEFVKRQLELQQGFTQNRIYLDETLTRLAGTNNIDAAIRTIVTKELNGMMSDISKNLFENDARVDFSTWFIDTLPFNEVATRRRPGSGDWILNMPTEEMNKYRKNNFAFLEEYIRVKGEIRGFQSNNTQIAEAQAQALQDSSAHLNALTLYTNLSLPSLSNYDISNPQYINIEEFEDTDDFRQKEVMSIAEFSGIIRSLLDNNSELSRFINDFTNKIHDPSRPAIHSLPKTLEDSIPVKLIRRRRKRFVFDKANIFSGKFRLPSFMKDGHDAVSQAAERRCRFRKQNRVNHQDKSSYLYNALITGDDDTEYGAEVSDTAMDQLIQSCFNTVDNYEDRYYIISANGDDLESVATSDLTEESDFTVQRFNPRVTEGVDNTRSNGVINRGKYIEPNIIFSTEEYNYQTKDRLVREEYQSGNEIVQFTNWRGRISEEIFNQYIEDYPDIEIETWEESVIDLIEKASPTYNCPGESKWNPRNAFSEDQLGKMGRALERQTRYHGRWAYEDYDNADLSTPGIKKRVCMAFDEEHAENIHAGEGGEYDLETFYKHYVFVNKGRERVTDNGTTGDIITKTCPCAQFGYVDPSPWNNMRHSEGVGGYCFANNDAPRMSLRGGTWELYDDAEYLDINEYKVPTRLLITQVKDSSNNIMQSYVRYVLPKVLDWNTSNDRHRTSMLTRSTQETLKAWETFVKEAYREKMVHNFINNRDYYNENNGPIVDKDDPANSELYASNRIIKVLHHGGGTKNPRRSHAFDCSIGPLMRYPGWNKRPYYGNGGYRRTAVDAAKESNSNRNNGGRFTNHQSHWQNLHTWDRHASWISTQKLWSIACQIEAREKRGNFRTTEAELDKLFEHRGHLVRRPTNARQSYESVRNIVNGAASRHRTHTGQNAVASHDIEEESYRAIYMAGRLADHDLYNHSIYDSLSPFSGDEADTFVRNPGKVLLLTIGNFITWFNQKRLDGFWGMTSAPGAFAWNASGGKLRIPTGAVSGEVDDNRVEGSPMKAGASLFYGDSRIHEFSYYLDYENEKIENRLVPSDLAEGNNAEEKLENAVNVLTHVLDSQKDQRTRIRMNPNALRNFANTFTDCINPQYWKKQASVSNSAFSFAYLGGGGGSDAVDNRQGHPMMAIHKKMKKANVNGGDSVMLHFTKQEARDLGLLLLPGEAVDRVFKRPHHRPDATLDILQDLTEHNDFNKRNFLSLPAVATKIAGKYNAVLSDWNLLQKLNEIRTSYTQDLEGDATIISDILLDSKVSYGLRICMTEVDKNVQGVIHSAFTSNSEVAEEERVGHIWSESIENPQVYERHYIVPIASFEKEVSKFDCFLADTEFAFRQKLKDYQGAMKHSLVQEQSYEDFFNFIIPSQNFAAMLTVHGTSMLAGHGDMPTVLSSTKSSLASVFPQMLNMDPFAEKGLEIDSAEIYSQYGMGAAGGEPPDCFTAPDIGEWAKMLYEMIKEFIKYFPSVVLRGLADGLSPAYKEMKFHYLDCQLPDLTNKSWGASSGRGAIPLGLRGSRQGDKRYAPLVPAFPVDVGKATVRAIRGDFKPMGITVSKLISYIYSGYTPFLDFSYAFQIPCLELDQEGMNDWSDYDFGKYGRYGHPLGILSLLALQTLQLPADMDLKNNMCPRRPGAVGCEDELE